MSYGAGSSCRSKSTPSLGTSTCCRCSPKMKKEREREMIFFVVELGPYLLDQITGSWVLPQGIKTNTKWMITEKNPISYKPCPNFPPCHSQAPLLQISLPSSYSSNAVWPRTYSGTGMKIFRNGKTFCLPGALYDWVDVHKFFNTVSFKTLNTSLSKKKQNKTIT